MTWYNVTRYSRPMGETTNYSAGDEVKVGDTTITLTSRKGSKGIRWSWVIRWIDEGGEGYQATPEEAIANAVKTLNSPPCSHGERGWCVTCHDTVEN